MPLDSLRLTALLLLVITTPAFAAEAEGGLLSPSGGLMFWTIITFVIVLTVLWKLALPPILGAVEAREQQVRDLIAAAERDRAEAQALLAQHSQQMEETRSRIQELVAEGRTAGERTRDEILAQARQQADELLVRARRDVRQEKDRAMEQIRVEAVEIALAAASKLVDRNLDQDDNRRLVREYLQELEGRPGPAVPAGV
jgi:F-type H+-transporting ATPase subunit b